jgi:general transcription factor 3C polypeptide 4
VNLDPSALLKGSPTGKDDESLVGWYRTVIPFDKGSGRVWAQEGLGAFSFEDHETQSLNKTVDFATLSLGSLDFSAKSIAVSPSGVLPDRGCIVAVLSNNMELTLWAASKNGIRGEWLKVRLSGFGWC